MFGRKASKISAASNHSIPPSARPALIETLEDRRLLSASIMHPAVAHAAHHTAVKHASLKHHAAKTTTASSTASSTSTAAAITAAATTTSTTASSTFDPADGGLVDTIEFSQAPTVVQTGLTTLASTDSLAVPTATQTVYLGNSNGVETYTLDYSATGTMSKLTVDVNGNPVTAPVQSTVTWATLDGTGTGSNAAAAAEISAIATALNLTAPTDTTTVNVSTMFDGTAVYSVRLSSSTSSATDDGHDAAVIRVDSSGNPVGPMTIPFSVVPTAVQNGINNNLPTGATALAATSTQNVNVLTENGVTFFSTTFTTSGTSTVVTVNLAGTSVSLPATTTTTFDSIPLAAQTELQTLATADGVTGTISSSQSVTAYTEGNGTVIYSVTLSTTNGDSQTVDITIASDQLGNPTVPPGNHGEGCGGRGERGGGGWDDSSGPDFGAVDFGLASFGGGHFRGS